MDEKSYCGCMEIPTNTNVSVIEEIKSLPIKESLKESILRKLEDEDSRNYKLENEVYRCHREIEKLEKAVLFLSKEVAEYKED